MMAFIIFFGKSNRILGGLHLFTAPISGAGVNVSRNGSERSWNKRQLSGMREGSTE
jgi:hypothetical protein